MHGVRLPRMIANTTLTYLHVISRIGKLLRGIQRRIHGVQVGNLNDFDCYQRAELIPDEDISCGVATRQTQLANATHPAAEVAAHLSAALAASAALLQEDDPECAPTMFFSHACRYMRVPLLIRVPRAAHGA